MSTIDIHEFVKVANCYPNVAIAYRIILTMSLNYVGDCCTSAERSFSKLKLLKNYLRSSISQERLNDIVISCIEKDIIQHIDIETIISDFAYKNARMNYFV
jgi:hypothetical protein